MPTTDLAEASDTPAGAAILDQLITIRRAVQQIEDQLGQVRTDLDEVLQKVRYLPTGKEWVSKG